MSAETVKATKNNITVEASYDFGDNLGEMTEKFGEDVVFSNAKQNIRIALQAMIRRMIEKGETEENIQNSVSAHVPGIGGQKADPVEKFKQKWAGLSQEEREKLLDELKNMNQ